MVKGNFDGIVILGRGEIEGSLTIKAHRFSKTAVTKIEAAGGTVELLPLKVALADSDAAKPKFKKTKRKAAAAPVEAPVEAAPVEDAPVEVPAVEEAADAAEDEEVTE